jgi:hypothetical protein
MSNSVPVLILFYEFVLIFYTALPSRHGRRGELYMWCWTHETPRFKNRNELHEAFLQVSPRQGMNS